MEDQLNIASHSYGRKAASIDAFCADHSISRASFYRLLKAGQAPRLLKVGTKQLITEEAAAEWRAAMTEATASPQAA